MSSIKNTENIKWGSGTFLADLVTLIVYDKNDKKVGTFNPATKEIMSLTKPGKLMPKPRAPSTYDLFKSHYRPLVKLELPDLTPQQLARELDKRYKQGAKEFMEKLPKTDTAETKLQAWLSKEQVVVTTPTPSPPVSVVTTPTPSAPTQEHYIKSGLTSEEEEEEEEVAVITKITDTTLQHQTPPPPEEIKPMNPLSTKLFELVYEIKDLYINSPSKDIDKDYPEYVQLYNLLNKVSREGYVPNEEKMKFIEDAWKKYQLIEGFNIDTTSEEDEGDISSDLSSLVSDQEEEEEEKEEEEEEEEVSEEEFGEVLKHTGELIEYEKKVKHKDYIPQTEEEFLLHTYGDEPEGKGYGMWALGSAKEYMKTYVPRGEEMSLGLSDQELYDEITRRRKRMTELARPGYVLRGQHISFLKDYKDFTRMDKILERMSDTKMVLIGGRHNTEVLTKKEETLIKPTDEEWVFITEMEDKYPDADVITEAQKWEFDFQVYGRGDREGYTKHDPHPATTLEERIEWIDKYNKFHRYKIKKSEDKYLLSLGYSGGVDEDEPDEEDTTSEEEEGAFGFNVDSDTDDTTTDEDD